MGWFDQKLTPAGPSPEDIAEAKLEAEKEFQNKQAQEAYLNAIRLSAQGYGAAGQAQTRQPSAYGSYGAGSGRNQTLG